MSTGQLLSRLRRVREVAPGRYVAACPGPLHENGDRRPSLSLRRLEDRWLIHCFAGCGAADIVAAIDLRLGDLFDRSAGHAAARGRPNHWHAAREALQVLRNDVEFVQLVADDMAAGVVIEPDDLALLDAAAARIRRAAEACR